MNNYVNTIINDNNMNVIKKMPDNSVCTILSDIPYALCEIDAFKMIKDGIDNKGGQGDRIYSVEGKSVCLSANGGGRGALTGLYHIELPDGDYYVRKLSVTECCRLQGFPDNFVDILSKTQGYKALGNSFTVPIIEHILNHLSF